MQSETSEPQPSVKTPITTSGNTTATDHVRSEDSNLTVMLGEWGFKILFAFFGAVATLLSWLALPRREGSRHQ